VLEGINETREWLVLEYQTKAQTVMVYTGKNTGNIVGELELPGIGSASISTRYDRDEYFIRFTSFNEPTSIYHDMMPLRRNCPGSQERRRRRERERVSWQEIDVPLQRLASSAAAKREEDARSGLEERGRVSLPLIFSLLLSRFLHEVIRARRAVAFFRPMKIWQTRGRSQLSYGRTQASIMRRSGGRGPRSFIMAAAGSGVRTYPCVCTRSTLTTMVTILKRRRRR